MKTTTKLAALFISSIVGLATAEAAITTTPIGITATFSSLMEDSAIISLAPVSSSEVGVGSATVGSNGLNFTFSENGPLYTGFGTTVPLGTNIASLNFSPGQTGSFSPSSPSGQYYMPFTQEDEFTGDPRNAFGYVTFDYDNSTQSITLVSLTVQDDSAGSLTVVAVPEPSAMVLLGAAGIVLGLRRSRVRA